MNYLAYIFYGIYVLFWYNLMFFPGRYLNAIAFPMFGGWLSVVLVYVLLVFVHNADFNIRFVDTKLWYCKYIFFQVAIVIHFAIMSVVTSVLSLLGYMEDVCKVFYLTFPDSNSMQFVLFFTVLFPLCFCIGKLVLEFKIKVFNFLLLSCFVGLLFSIAQ